jgi:Vacuole effluxer Atg22 like
MTLIFTTISSAADYGVFGRWLLFVLTCICWAAQFACMTLTSMFDRIGKSSADTHDLCFKGPSRWPVAMALYMISFISYGATLVFYAAAFPRLARNTPYARSLGDKYEAGEISTEEYEVEESMEKNRISNISTVIIVLFFVLARLTRVTDTQQCRVHFYSMPKLIDSSSAGLRS